MTDVTPEPIVALRGITKRFGDIVANDDIDLTLKRGTIHALLGENGSGKTTLMSILYGLYERDGGTIEMDGRARGFDSPHDAIDAGIGMIHQHFQLVDTMTVLQNIVLGHEPTSGASVDTAAARADIEDLCDRYDFDVDEYLVQEVADLDLGVAQRVEIVKSLYRGADVLIFDEPTAVLTPQEVDGLFDLMDELRQGGTSLIFITHKLEEAMDIADEITVLRDGRRVNTVPADETSREELAEMMVGREVVFEYEERAATTDEVALHDGLPSVSPREDPVVLDVDSLRVSDDRGLERIRGVDLAVHQGEILGIAGVQGNGQSELLEAITALRSVEDGSVTVAGRDMTDARRRSLIEAGIAYIPADRQEEGLVMDDDLVHNALLGFHHLPPYADGGWIQWERVRGHADGIIEQFDVVPPDRDKHAASLSGGNQQKFVVGRELSRDPELLIASHPTRGIDIGSIEFIHRKLLDLRAEGMPILLVSSKLEELQQLSDRIAVMYEGEIVETVRPSAVDERDLGLLMAGQRPDHLTGGATRSNGGSSRE